MHTKKDINIVSQLYDKAPRNGCLDRPDSKPGSLLPLFIRTTFVKDLGLVNTYMYIRSCEFKSVPARIGWPREDGPRSLTLTGLGRRDILKIRHATYRA